MTFKVPSTLEDLNNCQYFRDKGTLRSELNMCALFVYPNTRLFLFRWHLANPLLSSIKVLRTVCATAHVYCLAWFLCTVLYEGTLLLRNAVWYVFPSRQNVVTHIRLTWIIARRQHKLFVHDYALGNSEFCGFSPRPFLMCFQDYCWGMLCLKDDMPGLCF